MPCFYPVTCYYGDVNAATGKRRIVHDVRKAWSPVPIRRPCQQCSGCRLDRSRQWAVRCMHEKLMHVDNSFLTCTYDNEHLPDDGGLRKRDLQLFMHRLRKYFLRKVDGRKIRFYACGEYGSRTKRPHYHVLLFNGDFGDKKFHKNSDAGMPLYVSAQLESVWQLGHCLVGNVDFDSCAYVSRYICDKWIGPDADDYYTTLDGVIVQSEFTDMSRGRGIGFDWFQKYGRHAYAWDSVVMNGGEMKPPRYYDGKYELVDSAHLSALKLERRRKAMLHRDDNTPERRRVRDEVTRRKLKLFERDL